MATEPVLEENTYQVDQPHFQGPLDILLALIEQEALDITKISLARVTDQYLSWLEVLKETDLDDIADFLVIAAKLIYIKSEVLLPRPPAILIEAGEEDVGDELARQLMIYKQFKAVAAHLRDIEDKGQRSFVRVVPKIKVDPKFNPGDGDLNALLQAARRALAIKPEDPDVDDVVSPQMVTIGQQMTRIWQELASGRQISFSNLLHHSHNRIEVIVTLLAILELIKRNIINVQQPTRFGDILIAKKESFANLSDNEWAELAGLIDVS